MVWDLTIECKVYRNNVSILAGINNLFDEDYYARIRADAVVLNRACSLLLHVAPPILVAVTTSPLPLREQTHAVNLPRRRLLGLLVVGLAGTGAELLLLEHTENFWQRLPLLLIALSFAVLVLQCATQRAAVVRAFRGTMLLLMAGGVIGLGLHFNGNREFELEMHPGQTGMKLFWATLKGATPALAPGMLILLGCLGLVCTYQHPALVASAQTTNQIAGK